MPKKKMGDPEKLIKMIADQIPQAEIMKKLGIKTSTQLKTAYANAVLCGCLDPEFFHDLRLRDLICDHLDQLFRIAHFLLGHIYISFLEV